jgi:hypothetical protein
MVCGGCQLIKHGRYLRDWEPPRVWVDVGLNRVDIGHPVLPGLLPSSDCVFLLLQKIALCDSRFGARGAGYDKTKGV